MSVVVGDLAPTAGQCDHLLIEGQVMNEIEECKVIIFVYFPATVSFRCHTGRMRNL